MCQFIYQEFSSHLHEMIFFSFQSDYAAGSLCKDCSLLEGMSNDAFQVPCLI